MPYRDWYLPTSPYDLGFDRFGDWHEDRAAMREANPRPADDETHVWLRCSTCGKDITAQTDCAICGDHEDMAA